jgi:hypothetical protein
MSAGQPPGLDSVQKDLLWGLYTDMRAHARHAETLRSTVVNFMIVIASVLITAIVGDGQIRRADLIASLGMVLVGFLGLMFAASYTELHERNRLRAMQLRRYLNERCFASDDESMESLLAASDQEHQASPLYRRTRGVTGSTQRFWFLLPAAVLITGLSVSGVALISG